MTTRDAIEIVSYDPVWPSVFEDEARRLRAALGPLALRIDHHGSTSVPGLAAKPIIDIQVSVAALQPFDAYGDPLRSAGYRHLPHADDEVCPFFYRPDRWPHTHHVHVVRAGSDEERRTLVFRDYLRDHSDTAREYERLKAHLVAECGGADAESREAYARGKTDFVERVVAAAFAGGYPGPSESMSDRANGVSELRTDRLILRRWRLGDRPPFAALNADPRVMEHFPSVLSRRDSDALADLIERHFDRHGFGLWAVEVPGVAPFAGYIGLMIPGFEAAFMPCVEAGWRLGAEHWGHGYATEAARAVLAFAFDRLRLDEVVSFTVPDNVRSRRVMEKIGMTRDPADDFDHPAVSGALRRHVLYRIRRTVRAPDGT
jgi:GrpB-like predicted nucleotidyltransferase (UPF0157 family)/RimJ/RimL family protein N-acetyltransferase